MVKHLLKTLALVASIGSLPVAAQDVEQLPSEWRAVSERLQPAGPGVVERLDGSKVTGDLVRLSAAGIEIHTKTRTPVAPVRVPLAEIKTIRLGATADSLLNGTLVGAGVGAAGGIFGLCVAVSGLGGSGCGPDSGWVTVLAVGLGAGVGAGVGVGIDALRRQPGTIIYSRLADSSKTVRIAPVMGSGRRAVRVALRF